MIIHSGNEPVKVNEKRSKRTYPRVMIIVTEKRMRSSSKDIGRVIRGGVQRSDNTDTQIFIEQ